MSDVSKLVIAACQRNLVAYSVYDTDKLVVSLDFDSKKHLVVANNLGLNSSSVDKICTDKFFSYLLLNSEIRLPKSFVFIDPDAPEPYQNFSRQSSKQEVVGAISALLQKYKKIVIKPNSKSRGVNVFLCQTTQEIAQAVATIFERNSYKYDHVLLVQEYVDVKNEYRVVVYDQRIMFAYLKNNSGANSKFVGNLSPLHYENATADLVTETKLLSKLEQWMQPIFQKLPLKYGGLDIVEDSNGKFVLLEINSQPGYSFFLQDNDSSQLEQFFDVFIKDLKDSNEKK